MTWIDWLGVAVYLFAALCYLAARVVGNRGNADFWGALTILSAATLVLRFVATRGGC